MLRANGEMAEVQPPKQLANAAFMQFDAKLSCNAVTQIGATEPDDAVASKIGALLDPGCNLALFDPAHIASVAVFLASEDSRWLTGDRITASGGLR